ANLGLNSGYYVWTDAQGVNIIAVNMEAMTMTFAIGFNSPILVAFDVIYGQPNGLDLIIDEMTGFLLLSAMGINMEDFESATVSVINGEIVFEMLMTDGSTETIIAVG
ncbi:MAG: hypothetical protein FWC80_07265, partial [Firmicutes bacterium]|nr:hypothetical protein [Bacillota bacterium]